MPRPPRPREVARPPADVLQLLANPTNRAILSVLALEPQYPRKLAEVVGLTEDEASRRLRLFEKAGLAQAEWANVGKTVRLYRLATSDLQVSLTGAGVTVSGVGAAPPLTIGSLGEDIPHPSRFVGRARELGEVARLLDERPAVCVQGLGGMGKTTLAAKVATRSPRPTVWHTIAPGESGTLLVGRLAAALRPLEKGARAQRLAGLRADEEGNLLVDAIAESVNGLGALLVLDRFEAAGEGAGDAVARLVHDLRQGRVLITSRTVPREILRDAMAVYKLEGLTPEDSVALVREISPLLDARAAQGVYELTHGHALSLVLAGLAGKAASPRALVEESGIRDFLLHDVLPQLTPTERDVLLALSLLRLPFSADDAEAVAGSRHARDALLRLEARGLVTRAGSTFVLHDLLRAVASDATPEKRSVHKRAAEALLASAEPPKVLEALHHDLEAGDLIAAGRIVLDEATRHAYRFADLGLVPAYREQLERFGADKRTEPRALAACLIELALLDLHAGQAAHALPRIETAERLLGKRAKTLEAQLLVAKARLCHLTGRPREASALFAKAEALAEETADKPLLLHVLLDHAFRDEEWSPGARALYEKAVQVGEETSDIRLLSLAFSGAARMSAREGRKEALGLAQEALRLARLAGYPRGEADAYMTLTTHYMVTRDVEAGFAHAHRYQEVADLLGDPWLRSCAMNDIAFLLVTAGRHQEAAEQADRGIAFARSIQSVYYESAARLAKAEALVSLGRAKDALDALPDNFESCLSSWPALAARGWRTAAAVHEAVGNKAAAADAHARATALDPKAPPTSDAPVRRKRYPPLAGP